MEDEDIVSKIRQRRWQMLVHSRLYYVDDCAIISDHQWQEWANELRDLQNAYPHLCNIGCYDEAFLDWTGDTGFHLPLRNAEISGKALWLYRTHLSIVDK